MLPKCPHCAAEPLDSTGRRNVHRIGSFHRRSDGRDVQRFLCKHCRRSFSHATFSPCYRQKKRHKNGTVRVLLSSGVSQRRIALITKLTRNTVVNKLLFLAAQAERLLKVSNEEYPLAE